MSYRQVTRVADRFFLTMLLIQRPVTLGEYRAFNDPEKAKVLIDTQEIEITEDEYTGESAKGSITSRNNHRVPANERLGKWWIQSGAGYGATFDTPEKVLVYGDIWIDPASDRVWWKDSTNDGGIQRVTIADADITKNLAGDITTVKRK